MSLVTTQSHFTQEELDSVTKENLANVVDFCFSWQMKNVDFKEIDNILYHGFDYKTVYKHVVLVMDSLVKSGKKQDEILQDIMMIVAIGVLKGKVTDKTMKGLQQVGRERVNQLVTDWRLTTKPSASQLSTTEVTFARFALAFPIQACIIAKQLGRAFVGLFHSEPLPTFMRCPSFSSLIPINSPITPMLLDAANAYSCDLTVTISGVLMAGEMKEEAIKNIWGRQFVYTRTGFTSGIANAEQRKAAMVFFGMEGHFDDINKIVIANGTGTGVSRDIWNKTFEQFKSDVTGGARVSDIKLPGAFASYLGKGMLITDSQSVSPFRMITTPRSSLPGYLKMKDDFTKLVVNSPEVKKNLYGVEFEEADVHDDCSDIKDGDTFKADTENMDFGFVSWDRSDLNEFFENNPKALAYWIKVMLEDKIIKQDGKVDLMVPDDTGSHKARADWLVTLSKLDAGFVEGTLPDEDDVAYHKYVSRMVLDRVNSGRRNKIININKLIFYNGTSTFRFAVRKAMV